MGKYRDEGDKIQGYTPLPNNPDIEPGDSIEMLANQMSKQHQVYGEEIAQLQAMRQNLVGQIEYTDERIRQFETARDRVKRSMAAITGQDETTKPMEGTSIRGGAMGRAVEGHTYNDR